MSTLAEVRAALAEIVEDFVDEDPELPDGYRLDWEIEIGIVRRAVAALAALPADGVIVTPESLARALHTAGVGTTGCWGPNIHRSIHERDAAAILAALAAEGSAT